MSGAILRKSVKDVACEYWGWVAGRVVIFCNFYVNKVTEFGSGVIAKMLISVVGAEEVSNSNKITNGMSKTPSKSIYIYHHIVSSINDSDMIIQNFLAHRQTIGISLRIVRLLSQLNIHRSTKNGLPRYMGNFFW